MSDAELRGVTATLRARLEDELGELLTPIELRDVPPGEEEETELAGDDPARHSEERKEQRKREREQIDAALEQILPEAFAAVREAMKRALGKRHYDVQLIGGTVLHRGAIAEMKTGEGKTFVAPLAAYLNGLTGRGVHVVTVNDYLAKRDAQWIGAVFHKLGMAVGSIQHDTAYIYDPDFPQTDERLRNLRPVPRGEAYAADVTYGTNNEFGFDYLRDNLVIDLAQRVQRDHFFAIVDEVDNILIDEARTPLIISGQAEESADKYIQFARLTPRLQAEEDYIVDEKFKQVAITEAGTDKMERWLGVDNLFGNDFSMARHLEQALKAEVALPARPRLRGQGRRGRHRRRVHRAPDARPPLERGPAPGGGSQGRGQDPERVADPGDRHLPELLPHVRQAGGHDRYRRDRGGGVRQDLQPGGRGGAHQPRHDPRRLCRPRLPQPEREVERGHRRDRRGAREGAAGPGRHHQRGGQRDARRHAEAARHQAQRAERQVPREGSGDRRAGRSVGRGHHRHQHGRPRHRHPARRQPGDAGRRDPAQGRHQRARGVAGAVPGRAGRGGPGLRRGPRPWSSPPAGCTSWAPSGTRRAGSTTSCAAAPGARATRAAAASTCRSRTT